MVNLKIENGDSGQRLNKFLMKYLNNAPSSFIYKMLRKKNIVLNNKKAKGDEIISTGDEVKLYLSDDTILKFREDSKKNSKTNNSKIDITVLYENENIIAVHKKPGILSQKAKPDDYSINEAIVDYIYNNSKYNCSETFKPSVCNRLDMNTSGIILAGITLQGSQILSRALKDRVYDKYYYTIVKGEFSDKVLCKAYISKNNELNKSTVLSFDEYNNIKLKPDFDEKKYSLIENEFSPVSVGRDCTLLKIKLITGKSHQIRAHLKQLGYPIAGDVKYGDRAFNKYLNDKYKLKHHLLHAGMIKISDEIIIKDPLPDLFIKICDGELLNCKEI